MLEVMKVNVFYGDFQAVKNVSINVDKGSVVSLIGANGSGKTTLINAICGINKTKSGKIHFRKKDITGMKTSKIVSLGLTSSPEGSRCFENMTIRDNLLIGAYLCKSSKERARRLEEAYELFPILKEKAKDLATFLSGGQRQMLALARALMTQPKLLICDEISLGLAPVIINDIYSRLDSIRERGITLIIIDQDVSRSLRYSDYAYIMLEGSIVMEGKSSEMEIEEVNNAYFGINMNQAKGGICFNT